MSTDYMYSVQLRGNNQAGQEVELCWNTSTCEYFIHTLVRQGVGFTPSRRVLYGKSHVGLIQARNAFKQACARKTPVK